MLKFEDKIDPRVANFFKLAYTLLELVASSY